MMMNLTPTPSQTVGPYLHLGLTDSRSVSCMTAEGAKGERISLTCRVIDGDGSPVNDAMIEIWQADADGNYKHPEDPRNTKADPAFCGFGRMPTGDDGRCTFATIKPGRVPAPDGGLQAPHFNLSVFGRGILKRLSTRIYLAGDPSNVDDPVLSLVPESRRATLLAQPEATQGYWHFEIHLCGAGETVFFDV
jgi:protocatechuate 3,4-dioxygenase, alpha subunit